MDKIEKLLAAANERLKKSNAGIKIFRRGQKLSLRGMLPPKPHSKQNKSSQQIISLGVFCNGAGIRKAEKEAQRLSSEVALNKFDWNIWLNSDRVSSPENVGYWLEMFEEDYFNRRERNEKSETTWKVEYKSMFKRLPLEEKLSDRVLLELVFSTQPDTRQRKRAVMVANALAKFAGIDIDFKPYQGNYNFAKTVQRELPTDEQIASWYKQITNPGWQYAFGLMAAYGLRNHEVFNLDLDSLRTSPGHLVVLGGKTGSRKIWCLYPEWWQEWQLYEEKQLPDVNGKNNRDLGERVTQAFRRYQLTKPYNLRHSWAIRAMNFMPVEMAARQMGHSVDLHCKTYQRWIGEAHEQTMYEIMMNRKDRPLPPV